MSSSSDLAEKQLNLARSIGMLVMGLIIVAIDGGEMRYRVGGRNGAPAFYFGVLFVAIGLLWSIFAIKGYLQAKKASS